MGGKLDENDKKSPIKLITKEIDAVGKNIPLSKINFTWKILYEDRKIIKISLSVSKLSRKIRLAVDSDIKKTFLGALRDFSFRGMCRASHISIVGGDNDEVKFLIDGLDAKYYDTKNSQHLCNGIQIKKMFKRKAFMKKRKNFQCLSEHDDLDVSDAETSPLCQANFDEEKVENSTEVQSYSAVEQPKKLFGIFNGDFFLFNLFSSNADSSNTVESENPLEEIGEERVDEKREERDDNSSTARDHSPPLVTALSTLSNLEMTDPHNTISQLSQKEGSKSGSLDQDRCGEEEEGKEEEVQGDEGEAEGKREENRLEEKPGVNIEGESRIQEDIEQERKSEEKSEVEKMEEEKEEEVIPGLRHYVSVSDPGEQFSRYSDTEAGVLTVCIEGLSKVISTTSSGSFDPFPLELDLALPSGLGTVPHEESEEDSSPDKKGASRKDVLFFSSEGHHELEQEVLFMQDKGEKEEQGEKANKQDREEIEEEKEVRVEERKEREEEGERLVQCMKDVEGKDIESFILSNEYLQFSYDYLRKYQNLEKPLLFFSGAVTAEGSADENFIETDILCPEGDNGKILPSNNSCSETIKYYSDTFSSVETLSQVSLASTKYGLATTFHSSDEDPLNRSGVEFRFPRPRWKRKKFIYSVMTKSGMKIYKKKHLTFKLRKGIRHKIPSTVVPSFHRNFPHQKSCRSVNS